MDATRTFLDLILPDEGLRCAFIQQQKQNYFFNTNEELAAFLLAWDAAGYTTYHACSSYRDTSSRKQTNVHSVASLWVDVDAGVGKPYQDADAAILAVATACGAAGLPAPLYVRSGRGLHLYWPLDTGLLPEEWRRYATGLRSVLRRAGLQFDPTRICDSASILRTPGTHHRKEATPLPVVMGEPVGPYPLEQFDFLLERGDEQETIRAIASPAYLERCAPQHVLDSIRAPIGQPVDARSVPIADTCAQLCAMRQSLGILIEPLWYACLGVLGFATDGERYAHEWSSGYPGYTARETDERLERVRALTGATTCEKFHSLNPAPCEACPHWGKIKSPISLGYGDSSRQEVLEIAQGNRTPEATPQKSVTLPQLPPHFAWRNMSLIFQTENAGQPVEHLISTYPIYLDGVNEGETRGDFSLTFKHWLPAKGWFDLTIATKTLMQPQGIAELARYGANIHEGQHFIRYVKAAIDQHYESNKLRARYDQYGWKANNTAFLYGKKLYTAQGEFEIAGSKELEVRNQWIGPGATVKGDPASFGIERWTQAANALFAAGCEAQSVALLASFAAPLMRFMATDEGGAIISLVTRQSGTGKTTALAGTSSVWGAREGLSLTNDDNKVTKWLTLGALGNLPVVHDEIQTRDPLAIRDFVINFTNGRDKMRATREGEIRHSASTWQTLLVSASNSSLVDSLTGTSKADAPALRILELPLEIPEQLKHAFGDKLKNELITNAGYAGEIYIRYIVKPEVTEFIKQALDKYTLDLWTRTKLSNEHRFWIRAVACIAVAALIVNKLELVRFSSQRIVDWLVDRISVGKKGRRDYPGSGDWPSESIADFILGENINFLIIPSLWKRGGPRVRPTREPRGKLSGTYAILERRLALSVNAMRDYAIENEVPFREWVEILQRRGAASAIDRKSLTAGTDVPGAQMNVIELDMAHPTLAGADTRLSIQPGDDLTNVTSLRR